MDAEEAEQTVSRRKDLELGRAVFHMIAANSAMLYFYLTDRLGAWVLFSLGAVVILFDYGRTRSARFRRIIPDAILRLVRSKEEKRLSAITHFILAAWLIDIVYLTVGISKDAVFAAVMFSSFADPAARLAGKSIASPRLFGTRKTLAGSLTFFAVGVGGAWILGGAVGAEISVWQLGLGGALVTLIEICSTSLDNFHIPFFGSLLMAGLGRIG